MYVFFYWLRETLHVFFKAFLLFLHTILCRYFLIKCCQPVPVRFSEPELVAPHQESALDEKVIVVIRTYISWATSVFCFISEISVQGIEPETCFKSFDHDTKVLASLLLDLQF